MESQPRGLFSDRRERSFVFVFAAIIAIAFFTFGNRIVLSFQTAQPPVIDTQASFYDPVQNVLILKGRNFQPGATVVLSNSSGDIHAGRARIKSQTKIMVMQVAASDIANGVDVAVTNPGSAPATAHLDFKVDTTHTLTTGDVETIIAQAVAQARASGLNATIAVVDKEANVLGVFEMNGAPANTVVGVLPSCPNPSDCGLEGVAVPSKFAAISKAGTGAFLSSQGEALTTRTASFIVQQHFPPDVMFTSAGPLFGVQFSQLPCSDVNPALPLGLSADPGGVPLYKNGQLAGGIGVEGDGKYGAVLDPIANDQPVEELAAVAGTRGFEAPDAIKGNQILVNGIRLPFVNTPMPAQGQVPAFGSLPGQVDPGFPIRPAQPSRFQIVTVDGIPVRISTRFFPTKPGSVLSAAEVQQLLIQAIKQSNITRAAIRQPLGSAAQVNVSVVDTDGTVLGVVSDPDAPLFGFDVSAQKARTAAFFSGSAAGSLLRSDEHGRLAPFVDAANADGLKLDGSVAFTDRAGGFLSRPFFPDGIDGTANGPFSRPIQLFSPFNDGLQLELVKTALFNVLNNRPVSGCTGIPSLPNGTQIFPGSVPLYKNGNLVGAIGVSGDGVDQDDLISTMGSTGFEAPAGIRSDRVFVRGVRLPYVKFPRHPDL